MKSIINKRNLYTAGIVAFLAVILSDPTLASAVSDKSGSSSLGASAAIMMMMFSCLFFLPVLIIPVFALAALAITIYLIIDATNRDFGKDENMLAVSVLLLVLAGFPVGAILYYFIVMQKYPLKKGK